MADCPFCKIAAAEADAAIVYESDRVVAFRDVDPSAPTHVLVIPREHVASAGDVTRAHADIVGEIFEALSRVADQERLSGGWRLVTNVGRAAGQSVDHLHFHLLGGRRMSWPPG